MEIKGVTHPYRQNMLKMIYNGKKIFLSKSHLGNVSKGDKLKFTSLMELKLILAGLT